MTNNKHEEKNRKVLLDVYREDEKLLYLTHRLRDSRSSNTDEKMLQHIFEAYWQDIGEEGA